MKWNKKDLPKNGDIRRKRKLLLFPINIGNEVRWLEFAIIEQVYDEGDRVPTVGMIGRGWHNNKWID